MSLSGEKADIGSFGRRTGVRCEGGDGDGDQAEGW